MTIFCYDFKKTFHADEKVNSFVGRGALSKLRDKKYLLLFFFRVGHFYMSKEKKNRFLLAIIKLFFSKYKHAFLCEFDMRTKIGGGFFLPHPNGIVLHPLVIIGKNCTIMQQVTIGNNLNKGKDKVAKIGDNVLIGAGARIVGPCIIGNNVDIGANAVVICDVPSNSIAVGVPAVIKPK